MKSISLQVSPSDYDAFQAAAAEQGRSVAGLIREAMAIYRRERIEARDRLTDLPLLAGHRPLAPLPARAEVHDEVLAARGGQAALQSLRSRGRTR